MSSKKSARKHAVSATRGSMAPSREGTKSTEPDASIQEVSGTSAQVSAPALGSEEPLESRDSSEASVTSSPVVGSEPEAAGEQAVLEAGPPLVDGAGVLEAEVLHLASTGGPDRSVRDLQVETPEGSAAPPGEETVEATSPVNYDEPGLLEVQLGDHEYRFDTGKQGTALCVSGRNEGTYRWGFLGEVRWDGRDLRSRAFDRKLLGQLSVELRRFAAEASE